MADFNFNSSTPEPSLDFRFGTAPVHDFDFADAVSPSLDFNFGGGVATVTGTVSASTALTATLRGTSGTAGTVFASVPLPTAAITGIWDPDTWRGAAHKPRIVHSAGSTRQTCFGVPWQFPDFHHPAKAAVWQDGAASCPEVDLWLSDLIPAPRPRDIPWTVATPLAGQAREPFILAWPRHLSRCGLSAAGSPRSTGYSAPFVRCWPRPATKCTGYADGCQIRFSRRDAWSPATCMGTACRAPTACFSWQPGRHPPFIWPVPIVPGPEPGPGFSGSLDLNLICLLPDPIWGGIMFNLGAADVCRQALPVGWQPTITKVIIVTHDLWIKLLSDGTYLPCTAVTLSIDRDSWGWSWSANLPERRPELVASQHDVEINIDGHRWQGIVESMQGDRQHGKAAYRIGGRSLAATLAPPYTAPRGRTETSDRTAVQLATDELYDTGWTLDWQSVDWLVNGGVFSYSDLAPIGAIKQIAAAVDGIVQAHRTDLVLAVLPRYAVSPWELAGATLDASIPLELVLTEGITWQPRTLMNGVWVSGQNQGVRVRVYRTGTDGAPYSQMIVDPLITHIDAGRERGRNALAATGSRREVRLSMPLVASLGVLTPGMVVEVEDSPAWRGYVDAVEIAATRAAVNQTATIEHIG